MIGRTLVWMVAAVVLSVLTMPGILVAAEPSKKLNINEASQLQIGMSLNPVVGKDICHVTTGYRRRHGAFKSIEDIKKVPKIGDKEFALIKDKICVDC